MVSKYLLYLIKVNAHIFMFQLCSIFYLICPRQQHFIFRHQNSNSDMLDILEGNGGVLVIWLLILGDWRGVKMMKRKL